MKLLSCICFCLFAISASAVFSARPVQIMIPERGAVAGYEITQETNHFQCIAPPSVELAGVEESIQKLTLKPSRGGFLMSVQFTTNYLAAAGEKKLETARSRVLSHFPESELLESGVTYTGNGAAFYFEFVWGSERHLHSRVVVQELDGALCELVFASDKNEYKAHIGAFGNFLSSFRQLRK